MVRALPTGFDDAIYRAEDRGEGDLARRIKAERRMARALVNRALRAGYSVSVFDSEEWVVKRSRDRAAIYAALFSTDEDQIRIYDKAGESLGYFWLIYGNDGWDVIHDHADNEVCNAIWDDTLRPLSDRIEAGR